MKPPLFKLTVNERASPVWARIKTHLTQLLNERRELNDAPLPKSTTAKLRGEISMLKELLDLDVDRTP